MIVVVIGGASSTGRWQSAAGWSGLSNGVGAGHRRSRETPGAHVFHRGHREIVEHRPPMRRNRVGCAERYVMYAAKRPVGLVENRVARRYVALHVARYPPISNTCTRVRDYPGADIRASGAC